MARVLVVEDQQENLELMVYLLRTFGHHVATAGNGREGLEAARHERPDLMVVDIQMPVMNGFELVAALKADLDLAPIPAIGVTALAMVGDRDRILAAGFDGYLSKPIDPSKFVSELEGFLEYRGPAPPPGRATVLIVDDRQENLDLLEYLLRRSGHVVATALGGRAGMEKAQLLCPGLMVIDLKMPEIDGWELARWVRNDRDLVGTRLLAVSVDTASVTGALEAGFDGFFAMPFEPQDLTATVDTILSSDRRSPGEAVRSRDGWAE